MRVLAFDFPFAPLRLFAAVLRRHLVRFVRLSISPPRTGLLPRGEFRRLPAICFSFCSMSFLLVYYVCRCYLCGGFCFRYLPCVFPLRLLAIVAETEPCTGAGSAVNIAFRRRWSVRCRFLHLFRLLLYFVENARFKCRFENPRCSAVRRIYLSVLFSSE